MGGGAYSSTNRSVRASSLGYDKKPKEEIFVNQNINSAMNPFGVGIRESRDSAEHPNSLAIGLGLDVTGSMGTVPHFLVKEGLPMMMDAIIKKGIADPQVLFMGVGDHTCDSAPLQVGQFESSDELLDKWLTELYLEGHGGANDGESYMLPWYFAGFHTAIDCFEKRGQKGFLFTVGDEKVLPSVPASFLKRLMGDGQYQNFSSAELLEKAQEKYNVFHIHVRETGTGHRQETMDEWTQLMRDHLLIAERRTDIAHIIVETVGKLVSPETMAPEEPAPPAPEADQPKKEEMML
jgi:hypothetical protein